MIGRAFAVHHRRGILAVCDNNFQGREPTCLESTLFEDGVHQRHTQPFAHADQGGLGVVAEFVKQLQPFTNGTCVRQTFFDFGDHSVSRSPLEQG